MGIAEEIENELRVSFFKISDPAVSDSPELKIQNSKGCSFLHPLLLDVL